MKPTIFAPSSARLAAFVVAFAIAACGSDTESGAEEMDNHMSMGDSNHSMADMNMGDLDATAADEVSGAALARGEYVLFDTRPGGYDDVAGTAVIARHSAGTTVTTKLSGLLPNVDYVGHLHAQACSNDNAGPHYQFEVGRSDLPPNEIHLAFTSDGDGGGFMTVENDRIAGLDAVSFVVHPAEFIDNKIACVDLVEDEEGAAAAIIEVTQKSGGSTGGMDSLDEFDD